MSGSRRERRQGWERGKIERQERERERERDRYRDRGGRERERRSDRGEREKITNTKNSWNFILSCFNPVTRDKVGKKEIERETGWDRQSGKI